MAAGLQIQIYCNRSVIGKTIRYIDLFSGIGGFREGLTRAGGFTCIGHCEIDEKANRSYETLFDTKESGSVKISKKPIRTKFPTSTSCAEDFPASLFRLPGTAEALQTREVPCSLKLPG